MTNKPDDKKQFLRKLIRSIRQTYTDENLSVSSKHLFERLEQMAWFKNAQRIVCYHALPDEVNTLQFIEKWAPQKNIYLPVITDEYNMELRRFTGNTHLKYNRFHIPEPVHGEPATIDDIDLILVPGVAFDRAFYRLGRGKGYYDRLLANAQAKKIGICFDFQLVDTVPYDKHDIKMDGILTPSEFISW